jgi:outer membrane protein OmpA-like peptidoglycan-associated protein/tetratricopeptide (TPR) repeat protein
MKKHILSIILFSTLSVNAQSIKEKIANKHFVNLEYAAAVEMYEELADKHNKLKDFTRAAECNYMIGNYTKAELYYEKGFSTKKGLTNYDLYNYYQTLKYNANYEKASKVFSKIDTTQYKLIRDNIAKKKITIDELKKDSSNYTLKRLDLNSDENDFSPFVVDNSLYFLSSRRNSYLSANKYGWDNSYYLDVYQASIEGGEIKEAKSITDKDLKTKYHEGPLCFTKDGKTEFITRNNLVNNKLKRSKKNRVNLKILFRQKDGEKWGEWTEFPFNSNEYTCEHPTVTSDGKKLYFVSDMPGTLGSLDVWVSNFENNAWTKPENLGQAVNSEGREAFPMLFEDEVLFYSSDGKIGVGGLDIFYTIPAGDSYFEAQNLGYPVNSTSDDFGFFATSMTKGYLSSNRGKTKDDIYSFISNKPLVSNGLEVIVKDKATMEVLPEASVVIVGENDKKAGDAVTDTKGSTSFMGITPASYSINSTKDGYMENVTLITAPEMSSSLNKKVEVLLEKKIIGLLGVIADKDDLKPIEGAKVTFLDAATDAEIMSFVTNKDGDFRHVYSDKKIGDELAYKVKFERDGYLTKVLPVNIPIRKYGYNVLRDYLNVKMYKAKIGEDIGKMIDLKPIYFDLGKYNIRPDAATELNKIVELMTLNPKIDIELGAHTDCRGNVKSNLILSDNRAKSSAAYIVSKGIENTRITGQGYGESKLINDCACEGAVKSTCSEDEHSQNRRTEFKIVNIKP